MARPRYETPVQSVAPLGQPVHFPFSGKVAKNRFEKAAISERMGSWSVDDPSARGIPSDATIKLYEKWGKDGEIGIICTGTISVDPEYMEAAGNNIIPLEAPTSGQRFERFSDLATAMKCRGSLALGQLNHHGRQTQATHNASPISASDVQLLENEMHMVYSKPRAASEDEIKHVIDCFAHGAQYLEAAGFDGCQINAAHGYLFSQFLSTAYNRRTDQWGGSLENRARLLLEVVRAIRKSTRSDFLVSVKLNCVEFEEGGLQIDEVKQVAQMLEKDKVDVLELSGGTYVEWAWKHFRETTPTREGFYVEEAEQIRPLLKSTKLYLTGGWKTAGAMVDATRFLDGFGMARPLAQDPTLCRDILNGTVTGATKQDLNQHVYAPTAVLAGSQMRLISQGSQPLDGSKPETSAAVMEKLGGIVKAMQASTKPPVWERAGHLEIDGPRVA